VVKELSDLDLDGHFFSIRVGGFFQGSPSIGQAGAHVAPSTLFNFATTRPDPDIFAVFFSAWRGRQKL
jgi:hypothetical protein